jgi:protein-tyrosine phosphatase
VSAAGLRLPRELVRRATGAVYRPLPVTRGFTWIGEERLAIGSLPVGDDLERLAEEGVTDVVNCRHTYQTYFSQDLWAERERFGAEHVVLAPMWDDGRPKRPRDFAHAVSFGARRLEEDPDARLLVHCQQGRRRSALVAYGVLRMRGHSAEDASRLILTHRPVTRIVPAYRASVEQWLDSGAPVA